MRDIPAKWSSVLRPQTLEDVRCPCIHSHTKRSWILAVSDMQTTFFHIYVCAVVISTIQMILKHYSIASRFLLLWDFSKCSKNIAKGLVLLLHLLLGCHVTLTDLFSFGAFNTIFNCMSICMAIYGQRIYLFFLQIVFPVPSTEPGT